MNEKPPKYVQIRNPRTKRYTKINTWDGIIMGSKKTKGPYKNIKVIKLKKEKHV